MYKNAETRGLYISPTSSKYFNPELFEELEKDVLRTRKYSDSVCHDGKNIIRNDRSESCFCPIRRNSYDNEINNHGKRLFDIYKSADLEILNGRICGDTLGRPNFHGRNGVSAIEYVNRICF